MHNAQFKTFVLTFREPVRRCVFVDVHQGPALLNVVRSLVQHAIFKSEAKDRDDLVLNVLIALELDVGFEYTDVIISVALINGRNSSELFMIPRILLTIRLDDFFYGADEKKLRN